MPDALSGRFRGESGIDHLHHCRRHPHISLGTQTSFVQEPCPTADFATSEFLFPSHTIKQDETRKDITQLSSSLSFRESHPSIIVVQEIKDSSGPASFSLQWPL